MTNNNPASEVPWTLTRTQQDVLEVAAMRPGGYLCPTNGLHAAAQEAVLQSLKRKGLIDYGPEQTSPVINVAGRELVSRIRSVK